MAIEPVTREERFLAAAGGQSVTPPTPITRKEQLLQGIIDAVKSGGATPDVIENAVNNYLDANPVKPGATTEQAAQIERNKTDIADLQTEVDELKESGGNGSGQNVELDTTLTQSGKAADAGAVGARLTALEQLGGFTVIEPAEDDIPKVFFGGALAQTKTEVVVPFRYISKTQDFSGYAEIKAQGNSSLGYAKKNQTVKMFKDAECTEKLKVDFKGWGKQNKHVYKANWIDLTHARNVVSARIWGDVVKSRANYAELPELYRTSPNHGAVDGFPIKVYAAGIYQGRYTLNIPKDGWMANMDKDNNAHCILCGEGYVSGCFREASASQWTDELHDSMPSAIRTRWVDVIKFVMNSTDDDFRANLGNYFDVPSLIDYHLYGLLSCGLDAYGKNQLYMTYDGQKWFASMYDMDSTWGLYWNGSKIVSTDYPRTSYEDYVSGQADGRGNLLYNRLEQCFYEELQNRWAELKSGALSIENIINRFERFTDIAPAELVKEDYASTTGGGKFTGIPSKDTSNIQQVRAFALERQAWTDEYLAGLTPVIPVPCTGITLSAETLTFTAEGTQTLTATVTPDGCTDEITWESNNNSVATVADGVVIAVANGSAIITARCGDYSASCAVSVSGIFEPIPCTSVVLSEVTIAFSKIGATKTLTATVEPSDTTNSVVWTSSNNAVATVVDGVVTAIAEGDCTITATCGSCFASCAVSVAIVEIPEGANVLTQNYSPNGEAFTLYNGAFDLNTQKIVACVDLTTCTNTDEIVLSVADTEEKLAMWGGTGNLHLVGKKEGNVANLGVALADTMMLERTITVSNPSKVLFELTSNGVLIDGKLFTHDKNDGYLAIAKTFTNITIGSREGNVRSRATYKYIYIVDV